MRTDNLKRRVQLALTDIRCPAEDDCPCMRNLVQKKFPKILCIHLALVCVNDNHRAVELCLDIRFHILYRLHHIRKLSDTRRLNQDSLRMVGLDYLL